MSEWLFFLFAFLAEVIGTVMGFGSSTLFLPVALFFVDFQTALILVAFLHIFGNIGRITFFREGIEKKLLFRFGIPSVICTAIGAMLVTSFSAEVLTFVLGAFLLLFSISIFVNHSLSFTPTKANTVLAGGLSGFFAGLIGTGGPLRGAFLTAFNLKKGTYIATAALIALAVDFVRIGVYMGNGFLDPSFYYYLPILLVIGFAGSYTGRKIVDRIPQKRFKKVVVIMLAIISLKFVYDGIQYLFS